jgi:hypothetical protein
VNTSGTPPRIAARGRTSGAGMPARRVPGRQSGR